MQKRFTGMIPGKRHFSYKIKLEQLQLLSLETKKLREHLAGCNVPLHRGVQDNDWFTQNKHGEAIPITSNILAAGLRAGDTNFMDKRYTGNVNRHFPAVPFV